ncbi:hypothetical protein POJ06DRAFT_119652 [Lipomyces tetrasporus]|uniref:Nab2 type CCCH zinc finger 4 domain-containing protein n=1 Tax=Lipomyces tetrasporus TaxID=54092 RepID=A0AAD7QQV9_9ASCO|nr:uncharacterized protein POJ06DRAFT_119652 [Lipomyces tetrasporus]KAJ8099912.1 hypothetical protein POJ06DRAFT_119652 [Lipomyces tetrasporus]
MDSTLTVGSPLAEALQQSIGQRLQGEGFAEDETPFISEFITVMMCNNKGAEQIQDELSELLGPDRFARDFTTWLFDELKRLSSPENQKQEQNISTQSQEDSSMNLDNAQTGDNSSYDHTAMQLDTDALIPTGPSNERPLRNRLYNNMRNAMQQPPDGNLHRVRGQYAIGKQNHTAQRFNSFHQNNGHGRQNGSGYRGRGVNNGFGDRMGFIQNNFNNGYRNSNGYGHDGNDNERGDEVQVELTPRNRCRHWPYHMAPCKFPHPVQICEQFPNCPNDRGTCAKIHVGEDMSAEDAAKYVASGGQYQFTPLFEMGTPWSRNQMKAMMAAQLQHQYLTQQARQFGGFQSNGNQMQSAFPQYLAPSSQVQKQPQNYNEGKGSWNKPNAWTKSSAAQHNGEEQMPLCKFGLKCTNAECEFAHPTPANSSALILRNEACADGIACTDENCDKGHPSPASMRTGEVTMTNPPEDSGRSLEQCKYYPYCTNPHCKFRHPKSAILCRNGAECTRLDCVFTHPLNIPCRFDRSCTNPECLYSHPNGKGEKIAHKVWIAPALVSKNEDDHVSERKFAVGEEDVDEHLIIEQSSTAASSQ